MGDVIKFKVKPKEDNRVSDFLNQLEMLKQLYLQGVLENVFVLANGKDLKCCTSSGVNIGDAKEMCRDFVIHPGEYND